MDLSTIISTIVPGIAGLAIIISVITEVTKNVSIMNKIPTDLQVIVLSLILTPLALFAYASYANVNLTWYMIVGGVVAGFFVAFVCMYGWEKLTGIINRFKKND